MSEEPTYALVTVDMVVRIDDVHALKAAAVRRLAEVGEVNPAEVRSVEEDPLEALMSLIEIDGLLPAGLEGVAENTSGSWSADAIDEDMSDEVRARVPRHFGVDLGGDTHAQAVAVRLGLPARIV